MEEKQGTISELIYYSKDTHYTVALVDGTDEQFTVVGYLPGADQGRSFSFRGQWKNHASYGEQFVFSEYQEEMPKTREGIVGFLASGLLKGIGPKTAISIVDRFGDDTFRILLEEPGRLIEVDGIGHVKAASIAEAFRSHQQFAEISLFFQQYGISAGYAMKLYQVYGPTTIAVVQENPYRIIDDIFGIGFKKADRIAESMGIEKDSVFRIKSGIKYALSLFANEGHTFAPQKYFCEQAGELLSVSTEQVYEILVGMAFDGDVHVEQLEGRAVVYLYSYAIAEKNICRNLLMLHDADLKAITEKVDELIALTEQETGMYLSDSQKHAIKSSLQNGVCVITGGPGTGKTTIINTIMKLFQHSGFSTAIAAPTGRAAKRITETSGYPASTIHRLLDYYYSEGEDAMRFGKNGENPLEYDAVIIDEASMVDILLMNGLLSAIRPGTRLLIVGDADQLPSVGAGNVLRDMLDSEIIPSVRLTEIFRQAKESMIVVNAHKINHGEYPDCNDRGTDFFLLRQSGEVQILETIKSLCSTRLPAYYEALDPMKDVQILTPVRKGLIGSINLNKELQVLFNPPALDRKEKQLKDRIFREGDKVMQMKNNYRLEWKRRDDFTEGQGIFNGDVGYIKTIDTEYNQITVVYEDVKYVIYDFIQMDELELAYAMTVHKSQGSEFPLIILPVSWFPPMLATRNLLYTAVTRARDAVILVGNEKRLQAMVDNNAIIERYSGLRARLASFL